MTRRRICGDCRKALLRKHGCTDADIKLTGGEWVNVRGTLRWRRPCKDCRAWVGQRQIICDICAAEREKKREKKVAAK
jgi:hypothetical protein